MASNHQHLSPATRATLAAWKKFCTANQRQPSLAELAASQGKSKGAARFHLDRLRAAGIVEPDPRSLTAANARVLTALTELATALERPPSVQELMAETGLAKNTVVVHLGALVAKGAIVREPGRRAFWVAS